MNRESESLINVHERSKIGVLSFFMTPKVDFALESFVTQLASKWLET